MLLDLSVVFGTYNRRGYLTRCLVSLRQGLKRSHEIIVVDGGSNDGTIEYLSQENDVRLVKQCALLGCVQAYNTGFALAQGRYVAYLNDDLELQAGQLEAACRMLDDDHSIGIVGLQFTNPGDRKARMGDAKLKTWAKHIPYACFGVVRRELGEAAGWFSDFNHYCGDIHLALSVLSDGYKVVPLEGFTARHGLADNALRGDERWNVPKMNEKTRADWALFGEKWGTLKEEMYG